MFEAGNSGDRAGQFSNQIQGEKYEQGSKIRIPCFTVFNAHDLYQYKGCRAGQGGGSLRWGAKPPAPLMLDTK